MAGENLLVNPGFEDGLEGWRPSLPPAAVSKNPTIAVSADAAHSGAGGLVMTCNESVRYACTPSFLAGWGSPQPGDRFNISVWVRAGGDFVQKSKKMRAQKQNDRIGPVG